ncbi:MAG: hypothetical protein IJM30_12220 [Thermoguttaceae bacterium]|nr:hypothetical protein [Thermoguttaceae bacterium]
MSFSDAMTDAFIGFYIRIAKDKATVHYMIGNIGSDFHRDNFNALRRAIEETASPDMPLYYFKKYVETAREVEEMGGDKQAEYLPADFRSQTFALNPPPGDEGKYWIVRADVPLAPHPGAVGRFYMVFDETLQKRAFITRNRKFKKIDEKFADYGVLCSLDPNEMKEFDFKFEDDDPEAELDKIAEIFFNPYNAERFAHKTPVSDDDRERRRDFFELLDRAWEDAKLRDELDALATFETKRLPREFFSQNADEDESLVDCLSFQDSWFLLSEMYRDIARKNDASFRKYPSREFDAEQFATCRYEFDSSSEDEPQCAALRIDFPEPELPGMFARAYLCFDETFEKIGYYGIEKNDPSAETAPYALASVDAKGKRTRYAIRFEKDRQEEELAAVRDLFFNGGEAETANPKEESEAFAARAARFMEKLADEKNREDEEDYDDEEEEEDRAFFGYGRDYDDEDEEDYDEEIYEEDDYEEEEEDE